jgi:hypothetical protein
MFKFFRLIALGFAGLLLLAGPVWGQNLGAVGYGDWQLHLPTNHPLHVVDAGDRVYVVAASAFYFLDKNQNTTQVLSSRDGLNDVSVVAAAYDSVSKQTVIGYRNTNLDILRANGSIRNLGDLLRKSIQGKKEINQISIGGTKAYVSTSFGLVVIDLLKYEVSDTYSNIGPGGALVSVNDATVANGYLYLATSVGLLRGRLTDNLLDYRNWTLRDPVNAGAAAQNVYRFVVTYAGQVYASVGGSGQSLYKYVASTNSWASVNNTYTFSFRNLHVSGAGVLLVDDDSGIRRMDRNETVTSIVPPARGTYTLDAVRGRDGYYYVANYQNGFQRVTPGAGGAVERYVANGPATAAAFSLLADAHTNKVNVFTGKYEERYSPTGQRDGFYEYAEGQWANFNATEFPSLTDFPNPNSPVRGARTPDGTLYVGNYGGGLLEWKSKGNFRQFGENTPSGTPLLGTFGDRNRVEITDLASTTDGKLWVVNRHLRPFNSGLFLFDPTANTWQTIPYVSGLEALERIVLDDNEYAWASVSRKTDPTGAALGIFVVDPATTNPKPPRFFNKASGGLPSDNIYGLAKDRRGYIWAATAEGVAVFRGTGDPFDTSVAFDLPIVTESRFPTLFTEVVRTLAVDGGDRKWFGTDNGLWLFSPDADVALQHFTVANSPLPSNRIVDVKVNDKTGEVWVATDAGVVAYRGSATVTEGEPKCTAVFPNPVRPDFGGVVGITGLANNALVKITDVAGHLVYATTANGGTVTWNLTNPNGERVRSGIYLVLSSDADGKNGCVSKVAVLSK